MVFQKLNDLSNSDLRKRFFDDVFVPETNIAVAFGRVSIERNKKKGNSDIAQLETIGNYAEQEGLKVIRSWDVAETGSKHRKRKHFRGMIDFIKANPKVKHLIFSHQSRSNRNRESAHELSLLVERLGICIHCARDNLKLTPKSTMDEWLRWDLFNILNEKSTKDHTRNVLDGTIKKIEQGIFPGKAPFGYKNFRPAVDASSYFVFDPVEKPVMEKAFELFATGDFSVAALARELKTRFPGVEIPSYKRLWELLTNPFYYGDFKYDEVYYKGNPEFHPPMISFSLWREVQDVFDRPNRTKQSCNRKHPYIGLIRCGGRILDSRGVETDELCDCAVTGERVKLNLYWRCSNTTRKCSQRDLGFVKASGRKTISYRESELEDLMGKMFDPLHFSPEVCQWMQKMLQEEHREKSLADRQSRSAVQTRYEMVSRYIEKAYQDRIEGLVDEQVWRKKNGEWMLEQEQLRKRLAEMSATNSDYLETGVLLIELAQRTKTLYESAAPDIKRKLVEIISSNRRLRNGSLEFDYRKPFNFLAGAGEKSPREDWWTQRDAYRTFCQQNSLPQVAEIKRLLSA